MGHPYGAEGLGLLEPDPRQSEATEHRHARRAAFWLRMHGATLGGIPGAGSAKSRRRDQEQRDWRGTFAFRAEHDAAVVQLFNARQPVIYEGLVDGERRTLEVRLTSYTLQAGLAFFEGSETPRD